MTSYWLQDTWSIIFAAARICSFCATLPFSSFLYLYLCRVECLLEEADPRDWSSFKAHTRQTIWQPCRISMLSNAVCIMLDFCRGVARFWPRNRDLLTVEKWIHTVDIEPARPRALQNAVQSMKSSEEPAGKTWLSRPFGTQCLIASW